MPLTRPAYRVAFTRSPDEVHVIEVAPADQLRAEVEGNRRGLVEPARQGMLLTLLWLHAASRRLGLVSTDVAFDQFVADLTAWERVKPDNGDEVAVVDPTQQAASSTASSSSLPASLGSTGSQPSSTTPPSSPQPPADSASTTTSDPS